MKQTTKSALKAGGAMLAAIPVIIIILLVGLPFVPIIVDNAACLSFENEVMRSLSLPEGAAVVDSARICANTSGTGDHTELCVAVIITSGRPFMPQEVLDIPDAAAAFADVSGRTVDLGGGRITFETDVPENGYVLVAVKSAPMSSFDLRGC